MLKNVRKALALQLKSSRVHQKNGRSFLFTETPPGSDTYTLIHGTLIKAMQGETEVFNRGLATLLTAKGISIADAEKAAQREGMLKIQLPPEIEGCSSLQHYLLDNNMAIGVILSLAQGNKETKKATS